MIFARLQLAMWQHAALMAESTSAAANGEASSAAEYQKRVKNAAAVSGKQ